MIKFSKNIIIIIPVSIILGGTCLYVYLCFQGIVTAWLIEIGYYGALVKITRSLFDTGNSRVLYFQIINFFKDILVLLFLCTIFIYWFSRMLRESLIISCIFLSIGAFIADLYFYLKNLDEFFGSVLSFTYFFNGIIISYLFNISLWCLVFSVSIILASTIKNKQAKRGIQF